MDIYNDYKETEKFLQIVDKLVNHYDELNIQEIYKLIINASLFDYYVHYENILSFINDKYNSNFNSIKTISTEIVMKNEYDIDLIRLVLDCATIDTFILEKRRYSYEEIKTLIHNGIIYPIFARTYIGYYLPNEGSPFTEKDTDLQHYYDSDYDFQVKAFLKEYPMPVFVPNELNLTRYSGDGYFTINELSVNEENIKIFEKQFPINKKVLLGNIKQIIEDIIASYEKYEYSFENEYSHEKAVLARVREFYKKDDIRFF